MQKKIYFDSDEYKIHGTLHLPSNEKPPVVIGSHGLLSSGDSLKQIALAKACNAVGIAYFRYDHRGCGKSSGEFSSATTFDGRCRDLARAIETILGLPEADSRIGLFGSSFGGAVSLAVFHQFDIKSLVTVAAPVSLNNINPPYITDPENNSRLQTLNKDSLNFDVADRLSEISNILLFHGDNDEVVPFSNALEIYKKAKNPKTLITQKKGDHPMSDPALQQEFLELASKWFKNSFQLT